MNRICLGTVGLAVAAGFGLVLLPGCNREPSHDHEDAAHDHHHDDELKTAQLTAWDERYEIFLEHRFAVAQIPTRFVTHVTDLTTFEPRREGPITLILRQGEEEPAEHTEWIPARAGIYESDITLPKAGRWSLEVRVPAPEGARTLALRPVKVFPTRHDADHAEAPDAPDGVSFLKEQQWKILSKSQPVSKRRLVERVQVPAQTRARPGARAAIVAPLAGQLFSPPGGTLPQPGTRVEAGDVLALLRPRFSDAAAIFLGAEAQFGRAEAVLKQAESAYDRIKKLAAAGAKSERELQESEVALATARAQRAAAFALRSTYASAPSPGASSEGVGTAMELLAPIAGTVISVAAGVGEPVAADQIVFTILDPSAIWIEARVPEASVGRLDEARDALIELSGDPGQLLALGAEGGRFVFAGLEVDPVTRTVPLLYELPNHKTRLRVGQAVRLHIETVRVEEALAVPVSSIVEEGGQPVAFVQLSGEIFQKRELQLGIRDGNFVQVLDGLAEGERVVTQGAYAIRVSTLSGVIPAHGHVH